MKTAGFKARIAYGVLLLLDKLPDAAFSRLAFAVAGLMRRFGGDELAINNIEDIGKIFRAGPPHSDIARSLWREARPERLQMLLRGGFLYK